MVPSWIGEAVLLIASLLFLATISSYVAKLVVRPSVLLEDLTVTPSRGAVPAGSMCAMLFATIIHPYAPMLGHVALWFGIGLHVIYVLCISLSLFRSKNLGPNIMPPLFLPFVGLIVGAMAGKDLGYFTLSLVILIACLPFYVVILVQSLLNLWRSKDFPPPVRASFAITLAPHSIFPIVAWQLTADWVFDVFLVLAVLCAAILLLAARWMSKGGYNPGWGAFTFPLTAFGALMTLASIAGYGNWTILVGITVLGVASVLVPYVVFRTFALWKNGKLAANTGAATA